MHCSLHSRKVVPSLRQTPWYKDALEKLLEVLVDHYSRTAYAKDRHKWAKQLISAHVMFLREHVTKTFSPDKEPLAWFLENLTLDMAKGALTAFLSARTVRNERVKSTHEHHHAETCAMFAVGFYKVGISALLRTDIGLATLTAKSVLRGLPNKRVTADRSSRHGGHSQTTRSKPCSRCARAAPNGR